MMLWVQPQLLPLKPLNLQGAETKQWQCLTCLDPKFCINHQQSYMQERGEFLCKPKPCPNHVSCPTIPLRVSLNNLITHTRCCSTTRS